MFLLPNGTQVVSGSTWETCDGNANCGGTIWEHLRYHTQQVIQPENISTPVYLKITWGGQRPNYHADWFYNYTGRPWTKFGSFVPDYREALYFDIGVEGAGNFPCTCVYFYQFGVASKMPVPGWAVQLLYPSFVNPHSGIWQLMEHASIIQGWHSYWKGNYRWGGDPYNGVIAQSNENDKSLPTGVLQLTYSGRATLQDHAVLW